MSDIVLATFNARYTHTAFGLRYLLANLGELQSRATIREYSLQDRTVDVLEELLSLQPRIIGLGVYIWNVEVTARLVAELKRVAPEVTVVLGGPEVSYEQFEQPIVQLADYVISGEADVAFRELCEQLVRVDVEPAPPHPGPLPHSKTETLAQAQRGGEGKLNAAPLAPSAEKLIAALVPTLDALQLPYELYTAEDIAQRVIYVEASRGCPFTCEFCLSALDIPVRAFPLPEFLAAMQRLLDRGAKQFKFVDRTFNLNIRISRAILEFFLERYTPGMFLHFEMIPDRLPDPLRELLARFPAGSVQLEIGVQTFNDEVGTLISRRQDNQQLEENFRFLRESTGVHIHADLIVGLPGETLESFGAGFDRLVALQPQEIQVGILKRLKGTPIIRHDAEWQMVYSPAPPFEILQNRLIDFATMQQLRRFARYWDLIGNSGNFTLTKEWIWRGRSPFVQFFEMSDWLFFLEERTHNISLITLSHRVFEYLSKLHPDQVPQIALDMWKDYTRGGREDRPAFLKGFDLPSPRELHPPRTTSGPRRQARHQDAHATTVD